MLTKAFVFLLDTFLGLFALALLLRFLLQWFRAPPRNPLSRFLAALTDWIVVPARRVIPGFRGLDLSTLVLAWFAEFLLLLVTHLIQSSPGGGGGWMVLLLLAFAQIVKLTLYIIMVAVLVQAVLTWVAPYSPAMPLLNSLSRPFLSVFQRRIPPVGNVDLSPVFVLVACQLLLFLVAWVEGLLLRSMA